MKVDPHFRCNAIKADIILNTATLSALFENNQSKVRPKSDNLLKSRYFRFGTPLFSHLGFSVVLLFMFLKLINL